MKKKHALRFYRGYFAKFYSSQPINVRNKILWSLKAAENSDSVPDIYFEYLKGTDGLYEIRIPNGNQTFRIFGFFDEENLVVAGQSFQSRTQNAPQKEIERAEEIIKEYYKENNTISLSVFIDKEVGKKGTRRREEFEAGYEAFKLGVMIQQARQKKGLTQEQVAELSRTNKSYISKLEKNLKDVRFSTLQRIITAGLGGHLEISIKFD